MHVRRYRSKWFIYTPIAAVFACAVGLAFEARAELPKGVVVEAIDPIPLDEDGPQSPYLSLNINGHTGLVKAIQFSPDSQRLYTAGHDKVIHVWRPPVANAKAFLVEGVGWHKSHTIRWEIARGLRGNIYKIAVSPDGERVAIGGFGARGTAGDIIWANTDDCTIEQIARDGHADSVVGVDYSSDGKWMSSTDMTGRTILWDLRGAEPVGREVQKDNRLRFLSSEVFAGRSRLVIRKFKGNQRARTDAGAIIDVPTFALDYYDVNTGQSAGRAPITLYREITSLAANRSGLFLAAADRARKLYLYKAGERTAHTLSSTHLTRSLGFSADGRYLAVGTMTEPNRPSQVQIWDTSTRQRLFNYEQKRSVTAVAISPDGRWLACSGGQSFHVFVWELKNGKPINDRPIVLAGGDRVTDVAMAQRNGSFQTTIKTNTGETRRFDPTRIDVDPLDAAFGARAMAVEAVDRGAWKARIEQGGYRLQLTQGGAARGRIDLDPIWQGRLTSDSSYAFIRDAGGRETAIAVGTDTQNGIFVYNLDTSGPCRMLRYFRGHNEQVTSLSVTGDRRFLTSGAADGTVRYWKLEKLDSKAFFTRWGADVALNRDGQLVVRNCVDSSPLFHKGVRDGDVIEKIVWVSEERAEGKVLGSEDASAIYRQMQSLPMNKQLGMDIRREGRRLPRFNIVSGWSHVLAVYIYRDDWIAWHPSGYYECSTGGARLIGWQINEEMGEPSQVFSTVRVQTSLYKPEMLANLLKDGGIAEPDLQSISQPPPTPVVEIITPEERRVESDRPTFVVRARAKAMGEAPLVSMQLLINGMPAVQHTKAMEVVADGRGDGPMDWVEREWTIDLEPGEHTLAVRADTADAHSYSTALSVAFQPAKAKRRLHLLTVAVNDYKYDSVPDLNFCVTDAERITKIFKNRGKGLFDEVSVTAAFNKEATREGIERAFNKVVADAGMNDLVVLFYSGHGERKDDHFYLVSHDANSQNLTKQGVSEDTLKKFCRGVASKGAKLLIMVDACRSGAMKLDRLTADLATDDYRVYMMASSKGDEFSYEHKNFGGGAFTQCLWLGMHEGEADQSMVADGRVDNDELGVYVRRKVQMLIKEIAPEIKRNYPDQFRNKEVRQTPVSNFQALDPIALSLLPPP